MEGAALAGAGQRDRPRKGGKRTKASKAQGLFEEEVKRLVKLIDVKLSLKSSRNVVEYEEALKSALASSASGTYGGMLVDVYVGVVSGSSPEAVKLGYEHVRRKLRGAGSWGGPVNYPRPLRSSARTVGRIVGRNHSVFARVPVAARVPAAVGAAPGAAVAAGVRRAAR